jgi:hypothetical protein
MSTSTATKSRKSPKAPAPSGPTRTSLADLYRTWAATIRSLRAASRALHDFHGAVAFLPPSDVADGLRDPSRDDMEQALPAIHWQTNQALQLLDNCTPDAVALLIGDLEPRAGEAEAHAMGRALRRLRGKRHLGRSA